MVILIVCIVCVMFVICFVALQIRMNKQAEQDQIEYDKRQCERIKNLELEVLKLKDEIDKLTLENHDLKESVKDGKH